MLVDENVVELKVGFIEQQMHCVASKIVTVEGTKVVNQKVETIKDLEH